MPSVPASLALSLVIFFPWLAPREPDARPREASAVPELAAPRDILREEFFALDLRGEDASKVVGYAAWRRRREDGGQVLELDVHFPADATRVSHVERATRSAARLVWREWRPGAGRTLVLEWSREQAALDVVEWGRSQGVRTTLPAPGGAVLPLYLLELVRHGDIEEGSFPCVDPLARSIERVRLATTFGAHECDDEAFDVERTVELVADDGVATGVYTFRGDELVGWRWQHGGLSARRIPASDYFAAVGGAAHAQLSDATVTDR